MYKRLYVFAVTYLAALALISIWDKPVSTQTSNNPCENAQLVQSVPINTSSAVSTRLVNSTDTEKKTYICNLVVTMVGAAAANTIALQYGTGATCQTGTTLRTGTFKASVTVGSSTLIQLLQNTVQPIPVGNSTCILTSTADAVNGVLSYALQ